MTLTLYCRTYCVHVLMHTEIFLQQDNTRMKTVSVQWQPMDYWAQQHRGHHFLLFYTLSDWLSHWGWLLVQGWERQRVVDISRWMYRINSRSTGKDGCTDHTEMAFPETHHFHTKVHHSSTHPTKPTGGDNTLLCFTDVHLWWSIYQIH